MESISIDSIDVKQNRNRSMPHSLYTTVIGSALLWAWGYLCFLSPIMFPVSANIETSIGIEYGFFASQASVVLFALAVVLVSRWKHIVVRRSAFFVAALIVSLSSLLLAWAVQSSLLWLMIVCGILDGVCVTLLGVAWGTRFLLGSRAIRPLVVLSFLISYLLYLVISWLPQPIAIMCVTVLPLISWVLWRRDANMRHELSSEVFPVRGSIGTPDTPGELSAGSWEANILPWRSIGVLVMASFIGNLVASVIMGQGYSEVESLFFGGILVCACIATMSLVPLAADRNALSVSGIYRITLTFTAIGLVIIMVLGNEGIAIGGALTQGSAFFLQVLIILKITQSTQELGISPLLSFSIGQGLIAGVVFFGNIFGKQIFALFGSGGFVLDVVCGCGLLALFFMLIALASGSASFPQDHGAIEEADQARRSSLQPDGLHNVDRDDTDAAIPDEMAALSEQLWVRRVEIFAETHDLTRRETEVISFLVKGRSLPYIADTLFVTTGTIKTHTVHIYRKLAINSRKELLDLFEAS